MKSQLAGTSISKVEVLNISKHGFWLYVKGKEYFLAFEYFPWFKNASITSILNVEILHSVHLYWPDLDVDLEIDCLKHPEKYPLVYCEKD
ncbi:MAG: DUF2442 domain-containing protein [Calditrichota bacterium]